MEQWTGDEKGDNNKRASAFPFFINILMVIMIVGGIIAVFIAILAMLQEMGIIK